MRKSFNSKRNYISSLIVAKASQPPRRIITTAFILLIAVTVFAAPLLIFSDDNILAEASATHAYLIAEQPDLCGDVNDDGVVNMFDITFLVSYLYLDGPAPVNPATADINNCDSVVNLFDITFLICYLFLEGPSPACCQNPNEADFTIAARHTYIRSYPEGGGVFIVRLVPGEDFSGEVALSLDADPLLNAELDRYVLTVDTPIAEIAINPDQSAEIKSYVINLIATQAGDTQIVTFDIEMFDWSSAGINEAIAKRDPLIQWLETEHPEFGNFSNQEWFAYMTYPQIWVVEHWTFLNSEWEMRICFHVMIPPYDWSMIQIRHRGEWDPIFAARRESDGTTYEIPISEYPTFYGY